LTAAAAPRCLAMRSGRRDAPDLRAGGAHAAALLPFRLLTAVERERKRLAACASEA